MRIPIIKTTEQLPQRPITATTQGAGRTWKAAEQLSGVISDIGLDLAQTQQRIRMARDVAQAEFDMEQTNKDIVAELRLEPNHDTYFKDWLDKFQFASNDMLIKAKGPKTKAAMEQALSRIATRETRKQKDYANQLWIDTEKAGDLRILDSYATEGKLDEGIAYLDKRSDLYNPVELEKLKGSFRSSYEKIQKDLADVAADQAIMKDPNQALSDLKNKNYLPGLESMQRQDKIEKAKAAAKVLKNEQGKKLKEAEKAAKEEEEREIGNKFLTGDYKDAFDMVLRSKYLTGDEKRTWNNAIETASLDKPITTDYEIYRKLSLRASEGLIEDPAELYKLIGKGLTIENVNTLKGIMKDAADPAKEWENTLTKIAIRSGTGRILKPDPLSISAFLGDSEKQAHLFEVALRKELKAEPDYHKRLNMLDPDSKEYIVERLVQTYDIDMTEMPKPGKERKPLSYYSR